MSDKPILFSGPMVRALIAGTKTQTRRALNPQPAKFAPHVIDILPPQFEEDEGGWGQFETLWSSPSMEMPMGEPEREVWRPLKGLRYRVGDRLYVRESWNWTFIKDLAPGESLGRTLDECCAANGGFACPVGDGVVYAATNAHEHPEFGKARWKPSIHMPRYASRITLTVTDVRVERLQDISDEDAEAEGCPECEECGGVGWINSGPDGGWQCSAKGCGDAYRDQYARLWNSINGPGSWDANPWVAAYTFTVAMGNIDQVAT